MKTITNIILHNFQSHSHTDVSLSEGVNIIIGPSDSGKTSIIRAIKWVLFNEPSGTYFIKNGENDCYVTITYNDGTKVTRGRSKTKNYYEIIDDNNTKIRLEGFGTGVPLEVVNYTGVAKVKLDDTNASTINISNQLEGSFLISETPSLRSKAMGKLSGIDRIDAAIGVLGKDINEINTKKKLLYKQKSDIDVELESYCNIDIIKKEIDEIDAILTNITEKNSKLEQYERTQMLLEKINNEQNIVLHEITFVKNIDILEHIITKLSALYFNYKNLLTTMEKYIHVNLEINNQQRILEYYSSMQLGAKLLSDIEKNTSRLTVLSSIASKLSGLQRLIDVQSKIIKQYNFPRLEVDIKDISDKLSNMGLITSISNKINVLDKRIYDGNEYMKQFSNQSLVSKNITEASEMSFKYNAIKECINKSKIIDSSIAKLQYDIDKLVRGNSMLLDEYIDQIKKSEICPFCKNKIDDIHLQEILKEYE